jgi:hypothetical protein
LGYIVLAKLFCYVVWPCKFKPDLPVCYDGSSDPIRFLRLYAIAIRSAGGDWRVMANYLPMATKGAAREWHMGLQPEIITSWKDLCERFIDKFTPLEAALEAA